MWAGNGRARGAGEQGAGAEGVGGGARGAVARRTTAERDVGNHGVLGNAGDGLVGNQLTRVDVALGFEAERIALRGWVGYLEAASLEWLATAAVTREHLAQMLEASVTGALRAARIAHGSPSLPARRAQGSGGCCCRDPGKAGAAGARPGREEGVGAVFAGVTAAGGVWLTFGVKKRFDKKAKPPEDRPPRPPGEEYYI